MPETALQESVSFLIRVKCFDRARLRFVRAATTPRAGFGVEVVGDVLVEVEGAGAGAGDVFVTPTVEEESVYAALAISGPFSVMYTHSWIGPAETLGLK
jgi:hypothetical protein